MINKKMFKKITYLFIAISLFLSIFSPISAKADSLITNTNVGTTPFAIAINETTNKIYVANRGSNNVSVIDGTTNNVLATIAVGNTPWAIKANPLTNRIYVANYDSNNVSVINGATDTLLTTINTGTNPKVLDINTITNKIYVANWTSSDVTIINGLTNTTTTTAVSAGSDDIVVNDATNKIYMTLPGTGELGVIDGNTGNLITTIANAGATYLNLNKTSNKLYSTTFANGLVRVSNGATDAYIGALNTGGSGLEKPAINENLNRIYIPDPWVDKLFVINGSTDTVLTSINFSSTDNPGSAAFNPVSNKIYVANYGSNALAVIDAATNSIIQTLATGTFPINIAINQSTSKIYVVNRNSGNVSIYDGSVITPAPTITLLNPNSGPIGTSVTVTGTNFGAVQGASTVKFNGLVAAVTSWSDTSISVTVPAGATTGNVVVTTTGGGPSNGVPFTVTIANTPPSIASAASIQQINDGYVDISYNLIDAESNTSSLVSYQYSLDNIAWFSMTPATSDPAHEGISGLSSSPVGISHTFVWNALANLGNTYDTSVWVRLKPNDGTIDGLYNTSAPIAVDVKKPIVSGVVIASQILGTNNVKITYNLSDDNTAGLFVEIDISEDGGLTWMVNDASASGAIGSNVTSGNGKIITWNAGADFANQDQNDLRVRIRARDKYQNQGNYVSSANFKIDTKTPIGLTSFTGISSTTTSIKWDWTAAMIETNFKNYEIWYGINLTDVINRSGTAKKWDNTNVANLAAKTTSSTIITGLASGTLYHAKIWAKDKYSNEATTIQTNYSTQAIGVPAIATLNPNPGFIGETITITGTNFGAVQGTATVKFNGILSTSITSWSNDQIKATVPISATTGDVTVTTISGTSNGILLTILTPTTNNVIATDYFIYRIAANSSNDKIYLALSNYDTIVKIAAVDYATNNITYNNIGGQNPGESISIYGFKINSVTNKIYTYFYNSLTKDRGIAVIDANSLSITNRISGVSSMDNMVIDEKYNRIFVLNVDGTVTIISGSSNTVIKKVSSSPNWTFNSRNISFDPIKNKIYVLSGDRNSKSYVTVINGSNYQVIKRISVGGSIWPYRDIVIDSSASKAYVINTKANNITVINTNDDSIAKTIIGRFMGVSINETAGRAYLLSMNQIKIINHATLADIAATDSFAGTNIASSSSANKTYIGKVGRNAYYMNNMFKIIYGSANNAVTNTFSLDYDSGSVNDLIAYKNKAYLITNITDSSAPKKGYLIINE